ncbi:MAG: hypothetical protein ACOC71_05585 [Hyphomicrobiales bacterium]
MQTSGFLAQLIGPLLLVMGAGMLANAEGYRSMAQEFLASRALIYIAGLLAFVPGLAIVLVHNVWVLDWRVIITLLGWLSLIGGTFRLLAPRQVKVVGTAMLANRHYLTAGGAVTLALGAVLTLVGYV